MGDEDRERPGGRRNIGVTDDITRVRTSAETLPERGGKLVEDAAVASGINPSLQEPPVCSSLVFTMCKQRLLLSPVHTEIREIMSVRS